MMPWLQEISYSRDACVAAVRDYYDFLTKMYLKPSAVIQPPEGGWPDITAERLLALDKTDEVVALLRHLPYIAYPRDGRDLAEGAPKCRFADWNDISTSIGRGRATAETCKFTTEGVEICDDVPAQVVGLTDCEGVHGPVFLLDTNLGIVHWYQCDGNVRFNPSRETVQDDVYDYWTEDISEKEAEWRGDSTAWAVADFFEILKDQFRKLNYVPISPRSVLDVHTHYGHGTHGLVSLLQKIYREHGWPDLERYDKAKCLEAVQTALEEHYPMMADRRDGLEE